MRIEGLGGMEQSRAERRKGVERLGISELTT